MEFIIGLLAAGFGILLLLLVPVDLVAKVETSAKDKVRVRLVWLFGLLSMDLSGGRSRRKPGARERRRTAERGLTVRRVRALLHTTGLPAAVARMVKRLCAAVRVRDFRFHIRFGCDDPADTGQLLAVTAPMMWVLRAWGPDRFSVQADFSEENLCADGNMNVRLYPLRIIGASAMFLLSPAALRATKAAFWNR